MTKTEQRRLAAAAAETHAITILPPGAARAPSREPDDRDAEEQRALAEELATQQAVALAEAQEREPTLVPQPTPRPKGTGVKGWAKAGEVYHADDAVIEYVAPNPKKPGSATHTRFANYAVGLTLAQVKALGVTAGDILWDLPRGFIRIAAKG